MKIITTSGTKALKIIPRTFFAGTINLKLTNESTGGVVNTTATASTDKNYMSFTGTFGTLIEGEFYNLEVLLSGATIYKDKVFCTDQTINQTNNN